jgi:hypothetical protein
VEGGFAAALVATLLVVISKRTLKGDNRDRMLRDVSHRIVMRHGTRFTGADLSGATFTGTNLVAADMTGTVDEGTVWGPGQIPHRLDSPSRFLGEKPADDDDKAQGDLPITQFLFGAANSGDHGDASDHVSEGFIGYVNGRRIGGSGSGDVAESGPYLLTDVLGFSNGDVENWFVEVYDEVDGGTGHGESDGNHQIAVRFVTSGTFDGGIKDIEMAGFLKVTDGKLSELRLVTDLATFNEMREAAGLDPLD